MNCFIPKQSAEIVTMYIENRRSVVLTQRAYRRKYRGKQPPSDNTIRDREHTSSTTKTFQ
ncbi:unnamed protein product [Acanthoscelides obtectus]|uniref:DUF4817 domain-containing protein n=1 Tax=Acanthoscelides obtectus TaxID=200917 RepID=A0A9P0KYC2_ACAOB|nr:unnamed protein product [Acanthoscelides obtectus]CAK1655679.1 hypothetical protein AOBTE_LOCUS19256 [Acanthoscelides obtectus]